MRRREASEGWSVLVGALVLFGVPGPGWAWSPLWVTECGENRYTSWSADDLPAPYRVNPAGSPVAEATLLEIVERAFGRWSEPCCSGAEARHAGTTTLSPLDQTDSVSTIGLVTEGWPPEWGRSSRTLAITVPVPVLPGCTIREADISFNAEFNSFCYANCAPGDTSFFTVLVHEIGHFWGLGHATSPEAVMYYSYIGATDGQLSEDDISGICTLYPEDHCVTCQGNQDCEAPMVCQEGQCVVPDPCAGVTCSDGQRCVGGECLDEGACMVCRSCQLDSDCGANGLCIRLSDELSVCSQLCGPGGSCPGDSVCGRIPMDEGEMRICGNPQWLEGGQFCPRSYQCTDCVTTGCPPGEQCFDGNCRPDPTSNLCVPPESLETCEGCPEGAEACLGLPEGNATCAATCFSDADCGRCGVCVGIADPSGNAPGLQACVNYDHDTAGYCPDGWSCDLPPEPDAGPGGDGSVGGLDGGGDGGGGSGPGGGCRCRAAGDGRTGGSGGSWVWLLVVLFWWKARRRARRF